MSDSYSFETSAGPFRIVRRADHWDALFSGECLGSYATPELAADDLAGGHTFAPSSGVDTAELGIPADLSEWQRP
jgi:hypothetical protein